MRGLFLFLAATVLAGCASVPSAPAPDLEARLQAVLARRGHPDGLALIDELLKARFRTPPFTPPLARELLARPAQAADAARIFERAVPEGLRRFVDELSQPVRPSPGAPVPVRPLIDAYVTEVAAAQAELQLALGGATLDRASVLDELEDGLPHAAVKALMPAVAATNGAALARAAAMFIAATARFTRALREAGDRLQFPEATRFESPIGTVVIGSRGADRHGPEAALIVDPGGDDEYLRAPAPSGSVSLIFDLAGNDQYAGADLAIHALSALVDFSGDDRYRMAGAGLGAAVAGASLLIDLQGEDLYEAQRFAQGAAAFGVGALVDLAGHDRYQLIAGGQGYALAGGIGLLWDRRGNDRYRAAGLKDSFDRGGGISMAQGSAYGSRGTRVGGGIGILRDDEGNDDYQAEMFAQGAGYYFAAGLLWDRDGNDRYRAVRYAQGNGTHQAVGLLSDERGDDRYALTVGVGQGMGLDVAVGILADGGGEDEYDGPGLVQGAGTANGLGVLIAGGRRNLFRSSASNLRGWGRADGERCLPTFGVLLYDERSATFERGGVRQSPPPDSAAWGGPGGLEPQILQGCIKPASSGPGTNPSR